MPKSDQRIFISYRRSDCQAQANGLHDGLRHRMPASSIFMDIDSIPPGVDFEEHIRREIEICDVVLVLIGDNWLDPRPESSVRRIDEEGDFVRLEIENALSSPTVRVVPVLVEGAQMPSSSELPESIRPLARINAIELSDRRWTSDLERLKGIIEQLQEQASTARNMRLSDVQPDVVAAAVASLPPTFCTKDLSEHPAVLEQHHAVRSRPNYHVMMGRYLAQNHSVLGLRPPQPAVDDRGAVWHKELPDRPSTHPPPSPSVASTPVAKQWVQPAARLKHATTPMGWFMVALPLITCGWASFVPPLWAAHHRKRDATFRRQMFTGAVALGLASIGGFLMLVEGPADADGVPMGPISNTGGVIWLIATVTATVVAFLHRSPAIQLPGTQEELERRAQRDQYRDLIRRDPVLAHSINVGRPDIHRDYSDGGLLNLNALTAPALSQFASIPAHEASQIVAIRERLGCLSSVDELSAYSDLSDSTISRLRETAVFL